jgi:hypothetical protein
MHMAGYCTLTHGAKILNPGPERVRELQSYASLLSYSALDSPIKGGNSSHAASAASQFNFFSQYPGTAPKVQLHSSGSPLKASSSKASRLLKPILDFRDIGVSDESHIL